MTKIIASCLVAITASVATAARAETIFLKCGNYGIMTVDLTHRTVNNNPASITPLTIDWETHGDFVVDFHIDRTAGTLTVRHSGRFFDHSCQTVSKPATKF